MFYRRSHAVFCRDPVKVYRISAEPNPFQWVLYFKEIHGGYYASF